MKISDSKKELARIISENDGWIAGDFAAQQDDAEVWFSVTKPAWKNRCGTFDMGYEGHFTIGHLVANRHQTILSRAEYFHLYPAPDADGWIAWKGGECPVDEGVVIDVKFRNGTVQTACAARCDKSPNHRYWTWIWSHSGHESDIIAYRLHKPEQVKSTAVGDDKTNLAAKEELEAMGYRESPEQRAKLAKIYAPSIEWLAADYRNKLDYANRKQDEADKANMESDAALSELEAAIAAIGFAITPLAATDKDPELVITDWRDLQAGDEVECTSPNVQRGKYTGMNGIVSKIDFDDADTPVKVDFIDDYVWCHAVKFIRRP